MTSLRSWFVSMAMLAALLASRPAQAQAPATGASSLAGGRAQVHFNFGAQVGSQDLSQQITPIIYDEPATIDIAQTIETGGLIDLPRPPKFRPGDRLRLIHGPFAGHVGLYAGMKPRERVEVLLAILGGSQRVTLAADAVEQVEKCGLVVDSGAKFCPFM